MDLPTCPHLDVLPVSILLKKLNQGFDAVFKMCDKDKAGIQRSSVKAPV